MSKLIQNIKKRKALMLEKQKMIEILNDKQILEQYKQDDIPGKYNIPIKYIEAEVPMFQEDRCRIYTQITNKIDKETGKILQQLYDYKELGYAIGIHRTASSTNEIFDKGLNYRDDNTYAEHIQKMDNLPLMLSEISSCESYKLSRGCFISIVPRASIVKLNEEDKEKLKIKYKEIYKDNWQEKYNKIITPQPIYYKNNDGNIYLRPEYINAYVPVRNKELKSVEFNTYSHNIYDESTEFIYEEDILNKNKSYGFTNILLISIFLIIITIILIIK